MHLPDSSGRHLFGFKVSSVDRIDHPGSARGCGLSRQLLFFHGEIKTGQESVRDGL